jgi:hypothetical protein
MIDLWLTSDDKSPVIIGTSSESNRERVPCRGALYSADSPQKSFAAVSGFGPAIH